ncbi:phage holin family protein [Deinococcus altitudinis]|uniref:phage holin family protein n=1 Tax=Deinococcus altitudinis TaxID=468914 RepID=UPI0038914A92
MNFLLKLALNALALWLTTLLYSGVYFAPGTGALDVLVAALVLGVVNALIRPLLLLLSLPVNVLTLGLFTLVVNGAVLSIVAWATSLNVAGFGAAIIGALILSVVSWVFDHLLHLSEGRRQPA